MIESVYTADQQRVSDYIQRLLEGKVGSGEDPIGFLIASHAALVARNQQRVDDYMNAAPPTVEGITQLLNTLWSITHSQLPADEMLRDLSLTTGVACAYLMQMRDMLRQQQAAPADNAPVLG